MLTVYDNSVEVERKIGMEPVKDIEGWFNSHIHEIEIDDTVKRIITYIDGEEFISHEIENELGSLITYIEKSGEFTISDEERLMELSLGAKAVICVYTFPKVVFDLNDGDYIYNRVATCAFTLPRGRFRLNMWDREAAEGYPDDDKDIFNKVRVVTWLGTRVCQSVYETYQYFTFSDRNSWGIDFEYERYYEACGLNRAIQLGDYHMYQSSKSHIASFDDFLVAVSLKIGRNDKVFDRVSYPGFVNGQGYAICGEYLYDDDLLIEEREKRIGNHDPFNEDMLRRRYNKAVAKIKRARQRAEQKPEQEKGEHKNKHDEHEEEGERHEC